MPIPVVTPTRTWPTRRAAEDDCLRILRNSGYQPGERVTDPVHIDVLTSLVSIHPRSTEKIGAGIESFTVERLAGTAGQEVSNEAIGFVVHQVGGSHVDFSYLEAIYPSDHKRRVSKALKAEIEELRLAYRDQRFVSGSADSDLSGVPFSRRAEATVVYIQPAFAQLAYRFAESEGGWNSIEVESGGDAAFIGDALVDEGVKLRWVAFYRQFARPQLATRSEGARRPRADETAWTPPIQS